MEKLIKKFRDKSGYFKNDIKFIFNAKRIRPQMFDKIQDYNITNNANIFVVKSY